MNTITKDGINFTIVSYKEKKVSYFYEECIKLGVDSKKASNWITTNLPGNLNKLDLEFDDMSLTPNMFKELIDLVSNKEISSKKAKEVFLDIFTSGKSPKEVVREKCMKQVNDEGKIIKIAR